MADFETLKGRARVIQTETGSKQNTASRVGGLLLDIINSLSEAGPSPNNEDINVDADGKLQLANRVAATNQKGYKILRKGVSLASQMTDVNTIYEVRYVFDLDGGTLTIPSNCTLRFVGGTIANGSLVFDNTLVIGSYRLAFENIVFSGTIANDEINVTHFGIVPGNNCYTRLSSLLAVCDIGRRVKVYFPTGKYTINGILHPSSFTEMYGDGEGSIIYNEATSGSAKCIIICSNCGALSGTLVVKDNVPKYAVLGYENGAGREGYYDFTKVRVEGAGADDYVIGDYAIFTKNRISDGRYSKYCIERIIDVSQDGADYILTLEHPASMPADDVTTWVLTTNVAKYESNSAIKRNIYVHDLMLWQEYENTTSGYYAFGGGYNCKFENLYIRGCTPYGSNFSAYCDFININCTFTDGVWDAAELNYRCIYKNIVAKRIGLSISRQNIGMQISNGSDILMENIAIDFNDSSQSICLGGDVIDYIRINGLIIENVKLFSGSTRKAVITANNNIYNRFENIKLKNIVFDRSTNTNLYFGVFNLSVGGTIKNISTENVRYEGTPSNTTQSVFHLIQKGVKMSNVDASDNEHNVTETERNYGISAEPFLHTFALESVHGFRFYNLSTRIADNKCVCVKSHGYLKCVRELPNSTQLWIYIGSGYAMVTTGLPFKYVGEKCSCDIDILFIKGKIYFRGYFKTVEWEVSVHKVSEREVSDGSVIISLAARTINGDSLQNPAHIFVDTTSSAYVLNKIPIDMTYWEDERTTTYLSKSGGTSVRPSLAATAIGNQYFDTDLGKKLYWDGTKWIEEDGESAGIARSGTFANTPTPINVGFQYFNTDTKKVMYWAGTAWYYADGTQATA